MSSELAYGAAMNETAARSVELLDQVIMAIIEQGKSHHGEKSVAAAVMSGEMTNVTVFELDPDDPNVAREEKRAFSDFRERLQEDGIPYICVDMGGSGHYGVVFRHKDSARVAAITEDMNRDAAGQAHRGANRQTESRSRRDR